MQKFLFVRLALIFLLIITVNCVNSRTASKMYQQNDEISEIKSEQTASSTGVIPSDNNDKTNSSIPFVRIYRTSGDYADNIPVNLSGDRTHLVSYPTPSDITPQSTPLPLIKGYLLDRRGIRPTTAFTTYTYSQYADLKKIPQPSQLFNAVIPGSRVTEIVEMPFRISSDLAADTAACNKLIREGLEGCKVVYTSIQ